MSVPVNPTDLSGQPGQNHHNHHTQHTSSATSTNPNQSTVNPNASATTRVAEDVKGAMHGVTGSMQAATGAAIRNQGMTQAGIDKMNEEDNRLAQKRGSVPTGADKRGDVKETGGQ